MPQVAGRYTLYEELASGGMATVHVGRVAGHAGFARTVAIKRLHAMFAKDPEFVAMLLDEARIVARVRHPNVVPTLDVIAVEGELWIVMEYVAGESLAKLLRAQEPGAQCPHAVAAAIVVGVLHGLHAAHEATSEQGEALDIVHRDVSPQNVLVGNDGIARVVDFGVAKSAQRLQVTREGQVKGKIAYMAPEQINDGLVDRRADIYAAAVVLWEALTSQRLFDASNDYALTERVLRGDAKPPSWIRPGLPPAYDAIVMRGLSRRKQDRFATARDMALALERCDRIATPSDVGEWVEATYGAQLRARAAIVTEAERSSAVEPSPPSSRSVPPTAAAASTPSTPPDSGRAAPATVGTAAELPVTASPRRPRRRARLGFVIGLATAAAVGVVALGAAAVVGNGERRSVAPPPTPAPADPPAATASAATASTMPSAPPPEAASSPETAPSPTTAVAKKVAPLAPPRIRTPDCTTPYVVDADGIRHIRRECAKGTANP